MSGQMLEWLSGEVWARLVQALGHSLWLGALAAAVLAAALRAIPVRRCDLRYGLAVAALAALVMAVPLAWAVEGMAGGDASIHVRSSAFRRDTGMATDATRVSHSSQGPELHLPVEGGTGHPVESDGDWTPLLAGLWLAGAGAMLLRAAGALAWAGRLCRDTMPVRLEVTATANRLRRALGIARVVGVAASERVLVPAVVGLWRPLVLLPASILTQIPPAHLEAILAHELAHVRRHDILVNAFQLFAEALLFFNPAAWWISRRIRAEREACCDALAARVTGGELGVAEALADCARRLREEGAPLAAAALLGDQPRQGGALLERVLRLTRPGYRPRLGGCPGRALCS